MKNILDFEDGKVTVNKENIVFVVFDKLFVLGFKNILVELSEFKFLLLQGFTVIFFLKGFEHLFQQWSHEFLQLLVQCELGNNFLFNKV